MKKLLLSFLLLFCMQFAPAKAQWVTIPDPNFVNRLTQLYPSCMNGNQMDTTCTQILNASTLFVSSSNINNLSGVKYFVNLSYLRCYNNNLSNLTELPASLDSLDCSNNDLFSIPSLPSNLIFLNCSYNHLNTLPILPNSLLELNCLSNNLSSLSPLPNLIQTLNCGMNQLTSLPALPNSLIKLSYPVNQITNHPILPNSLIYLDCSYNQLTSLPILPNSLKSLGCNQNLFTTLPILPNSLKYLTCIQGQLTDIPVLPDSLETLNCPYNNLTSLPPLPDSLKVLLCYDNLLQNLPPLPDVMLNLKFQNNNITCIEHLPQIYSGNLYDVDISNNPLTCVPNQTFYSLGLPLCLEDDTTNNPNNCPSLSNISGYVFTDQNNNCTYNAGDFGTSNFPIKLYDSLNVLIAQNFLINGTYGFSVDQSGTYMVKIHNYSSILNMACAQPDSQIVNLTAPSNTLTHINFPVECDTVFDLRVQSVNNQGWGFPGQMHNLRAHIISNETWYNLQCDTTIYSGTVNITVNGPVQFIAATTNAMTPQVNGNIFSYSVSDFNSLTTSSFGLQLMTDTSAQFGDQICVHVEIFPTPLDANTTNNVYDFCYQVVNSYDPNMKEVYPVNVLPGYDDWFTYTIHFQNTGNAPAFNIRLRDTLDANLDINSFEVRGYSHPAQISLNGNILTVRFNNIMLPDSTTDYEGSMGYFQYRLKPLPNLPNGTQIENTAYIYFDYNAPIITNTTQNNFDMTVKTNDVKLEETHFVLYPNPSEGLFMFKDNKNIKTVEVFNMMGELVLSQGNAKVINLQRFSKGIYVARVNGTQVCRLVKE